MRQKSIAGAFSVSGIGLHTGQHAQVIISPAMAGHGIVFRRTDLDGQPSITAEAKNVVSTLRSTTIGAGEASVMTVEHLLSALYGMGITNALVEVQGGEMPILDGTSAPFVEGIKAVGIAEFEEEQPVFVVTEPIYYKDPETGSELMALPSENFEMTVMIDFNSDIVGPQFACLHSGSDYASEISTCRTFVFVRELEKLLEIGLIKGGDLDNAIVIADKPVPQATLDLLSEKTGIANVTVGQQGILNTIQLRFQNEPARHKLLDLIGDLALLAMPIQGRIMATKPGHTANVAFARLLRQKAFEQRRMKGVPVYDPNKEPVYDTNQVTAMLPHRYPFLLVDKIIEVTDTHIVGLKNITINESFFQGHFPNNPIMPGVLQVEAMAQTGGILALHNMPDPGNWDTYFMKIENFKFKSKVVPGDTLLIKMELLEPIRRGIVKMQAAAYVGHNIVSQGELWAQVVNRKAMAENKQSNT